MSNAYTRMRAVRRPLALALAVAGLAAFTPDGPAAAQGYGFATFSASINQGGATVRGSGVQSSSRPATGQYFVDFSRPVNVCYFVASPRGVGGGQASVSSVSATRLKVRTFNKAGAAANIPFMLIVNCVP